MRTKIVFIASVFLLISAVLISSCSGSSPAHPSSITQTLDREIAKSTQISNSPSLQVVVVKDGQIIWSRAFGENSSVDEIYMNASVQKTITAVSILQLAEKGLLNLDTDINMYLPFSVRHPEYPQTPITIRMLLAHRSGMGDFPYQFEWDTAAAFSPSYRPAGPSSILKMTHEEFTLSSLIPEGENYNPDSWIFEPGSEYHYSVSSYPFLRFIISHLSGQSYQEYIKENIFDPLGMDNSSFCIEDHPDQQVTPFTRIDGANVEIPLWNGQGSMMRTTANDMAKFMIAMMDLEQTGDHQLLSPDSIELMRHRTTEFNDGFHSGGDLPRKGHGLGLFIFRGGWFGNGGSAPGYQSLLRYHPSTKTGFVIFSNVNAILVGGENYRSVRSDIYVIQDALISILDPRLAFIWQNYRFIMIGVMLICATIFCFAYRANRSKTRKKKRD